MELNKMISKVGSAIVIVTVFLFAFFLIIDFSMGGYFVCLILPVGFIMMTAGLHNECEDDRKVAANIGLILAAVYGTFIMLVYFSQLTTVNNEQLNEQAAKLLEFEAAKLLEFDKYGLIFNYDLLGYGVMALSTFFTGLSMKPKDKMDKWLRALLMIHGVFYLSCTFMPITGVFVNMSSGGNGIGGRLALVVWCVYFMPIGILSFLHFHSGKR